MEVKDTQGKTLIDVPITESAVKTEELMKQYSITLSWDAVSADVLHVGAYIEYEGVKYSLLAPYKPQQKDEVTYEYKPVFSHPVMRWQHLPFFHYTYSGSEVSSKETDWSLTDNAANFMAAVCAAINEQTGEQWSYAVGGDMKASASLSFSNTDIFSALTSIAGAFETEWWFDYDNKFLNLYKAKHGSEVTLEVGSNIAIPSATQSKSDYATRFYVFGSTRNIDQSYSGSNVNNIVNKRLTLNPTKYPNGYIDIREGLTDSEILVKTLVFDDIYPRSALTISDVRVRMMWTLDNDNNKVQIGTDSEGNPVYDQYAIWYFKIPSLSFNKEMIIKGKVLSVHFNSGPLNGREFELEYHDEEKKVSTSDGSDFIVEDGDFEIKFIEEGTYIIPAISSLIPIDGDSVTLFNIIMPEEYKSSTYAELEQAALKAISEQDEDKNNYSFESNPVAFFNDNPSLSIGRSVLYKNGSYTYSTRVIKLETKLDRPFEQKITIGNEQIKGNTQTLKEEVVNANQNIDLLAEMNRSTEQLQMSYMRTQKMMQESVAKTASELLKLGLTIKEENGKKVLQSEYDFRGLGDIVAGGGELGEDEDKNGTLGSLYNVDSNVDEVYPTDKVLIKSANKAHWSAFDLSSIVGLDTAALQRYLDNNKYITESALNGYATANSVNALRTDFDNLNALLNDDTSGVIDTWNDVVDFLNGYKESEDLATILSGMNTEIGKKADKSALDVLAAQLNELGLTIEEIDGVKYLISANTFVSEKDVIAGGIGEEGPTSGGIIQQVYGASAFGQTFDASNLTDTFNAHAINSLYSTIQRGVKNPYALTINGTPYDGSSPVDITISGGGGVADSIDWANVYNKPTTLGGYGITDALSTSGGTLTSSGTVPLYLDSASDTQVTTLIKSRGVSKAQVGWGSALGTYFYNYSSRCVLGIKNDGTPYFGVEGSTLNTLIHSGNIGSYNAGSATKLQTSRTIWGRSFDGTGDISAAPSFPAYIDVNRNATTGVLLDSTKIGFEIKTYANDVRLMTYPTSGGSNSSQLVLTSTGNVLIGTTSDNGYKLQVYGGATYASDVNVYDINGIKTRLTQYTYNNIGRIYVYNETAAAYSEMRIGRDTPEGIVIQSNGNVLIGEPNDNGTKFQVNGAISATYSQFSHTTPIRFTATGTGVYNIATIESSSSGFIIERARKTDSASAAIIPFIISQLGGGEALKLDGNNLTVAGDITAGSSASDMRLKDVVCNDYDAVSIIKSLSTFKYKWNSTAKSLTDCFSKDNYEHFGLSAQEVEKVSGYLVSNFNYGEGGEYLTLKKEELVPVLVQAVKQLLTRIEILEVK